MRPRFGWFFFTRGLGKALKKTIQSVIMIIAGGGGGGAGGGDHTPLGFFSFPQP